MKIISRIGIYLIFCSLLIACGPARVVATVPSSPIPTITSTLTLVNTPTLAPSIIPVNTLSPLDEEEQTRKLLETSFSIENLQPFNGHTLQKISSLKDFGSYRGFTDRPSYEWMGTDHLLMRVVTKHYDVPMPVSYTTTAVINLNSSKVWVPGNNSHTDYYASPYWSANPGLLISAYQKEVFTYDADGTLISKYAGELAGISPSGQKILFADDKWLDLTNGKVIDFGWDQYINDLRGPILWSENENRVLRCCYVYGDADTGKGYGIPGRKISMNGKRVKGYLNATHGMWIGNDYVLSEPAWADTDPINSIGFIPLFDPSIKNFRNLTEFLGLPAKLNVMYLIVNISPDKKYMLLTSPTYSTTYVVDLKTHKAIKTDEYVKWSAHGKFMLIGSKVITLADHQSRELPKIAKRTAQSAWHPTEEIETFVSLNAQKEQTLFFLNYETLLYKTFKLELLSNITQIHWSPDGDHIILTTDNDRIWQLDYPNLQHLEQLTAQSMPEIKYMTWSPDGEYLSFMSQGNIYIVDTSSKP